MGTGDKLPRPQASAGAGPRPLGPAHSPGTSFLGEGQGVAQLRDRTCMEPTRNRGEPDALSLSEAEAEALSLGVVPKESPLLILLPSTRGCGAQVTPCTPTCCGRHPDLRQHPEREPGRVLSSFS